MTFRGIISVNYGKSHSAELLMSMWETVSGVDYVVENIVLVQYSPLRCALVTVISLAQTIFLKLSNSSL